MPFDVFLCAIYSWLVKDGDKEGIEKFDALLWRPPEGTAAEVIAELPQWREDAMADQFMAQLAARGKGPGNGA